MFLPRRSSRARTNDRLFDDDVAGGLGATISTASSDGTPDDSSVPSVRVKRATAIWRSTGDHDRYVEEICG